MNVQQSACYRASWLIVTAFLLSLAPGCGKQASKESKPLSPPSGLVLGEVLEVVSKDVIRADSGKTTFRFTLRSKKPVDSNYKILFHGYVKDESLIPAEKRNKFKFLNADHNFQKPPKTWQPGEVFSHETTLDLQPGEYNFHFGLFDRTNSKAIPGTIEFGWMRLPPEK